jgi:hypothetical protein
MIAAQRDGYSAAARARHRLIRFSATPANSSGGSPIAWTRAAAEGHDEPRLSELIGDLSLRDPDFRTWWAERHATYQSHGTKTLTHPTVGRYTLHWQTLRTPDSQQTLMVMSAPAGSHGLEALRRLDASTDAP